MVSQLNSLYRGEPALYEIDFEQAGFEWIDFYDSDNSVISFIRKAKNGSFVVAVLNFTPVVRYNYKIGTISKGFYREIFNSDSAKFGGSDNGNGRGVNSLDLPWNGKPFCLDLTIPPLGGILLKLNPEETEE